PFLSERSRATWNTAGSGALLSCSIGPLRPPFPARVALLVIPNALRNFTQPVTAADDRCDLSGVHEFSQSSQVLPGYFRPNHRQFLAREARQHRRLHQTSQQRSEERRVGKECRKRCSPSR